MWKSTLALVTAAAFVLGGGLVERSVRLDDVSPPLRAVIGRSALSPAEFQNLLARIEAATRQRLREGTDEHLIAFVLQSRSFTASPPVEPALSAREFVQQLSPEQRR